jgi:hypothetical protein
MGNNGESRGVEVHMVRSLAVDGGVYTLCGHRYFEANQWTGLWDRVTCGNCLRCRTDEELPTELEGVE